jgi:hypothetical protein
MNNGRVAFYVTAQCQRRSRRFGGACGHDDPPLADHCSRISFENGAAGARPARRRSKERKPLVVAVIVGVMLAGFFGVMLGVNLMALRHVRVMTGRMMVATLVMIGRRLVVLRGMFVMLSSFAMMVDSLL